MHTHDLNTFMPVTSYLQSELLLSSKAICSNAFLTSFFGYPPPRHCDRLNKSHKYVHAPIPGTYKCYLIWQKGLYKYDLKDLESFSWVIWDESDQKAMNVITETKIRVKGPQTK